MKKIEKFLVIFIMAFTIGLAVGNFETIVNYEVTEVTENTITMKIHGKNYIYNYEK